MTGRLASAPVTWGVWERTIGRDDLVPPEQLARSMTSLGYQATELGPAGYFGPDAESVSSFLGRFGLELVGAFVPLRLTDESGYSDDLAELSKVLAILEPWPAAVALLADAGTPERFAAAGQPEELRRTALSGRIFDRAAERLEQAAEMCAEVGVTAALHPEIGSYAEAPAEVEAFLGRIDAALLGVCLDSGHTLIGGGDPVELARDWAARLRHVHLKDVSSSQLARVRAGELDVERAWEQGLFCPFGEGEVDLHGLLALPEIASFAGWVVLEQDRIAVRPDDLAAVRAVEQRNLDAVRSLLR